MENIVHDKQKIVILAWATFPFGSASASRLRTFSKGLLENGVSVRLITTSRILYRDVDYKEDSGLAWHGIHYECTNGYHVPGKKYSLLSRTFKLARAIYRSWARLYRLIAQGECTAVYIYGRSILSYGPAALIARCTGVPVLYDICEWFPADKFRWGWLNPTFIDDYCGRQLPRFLGNGVVAITSHIKEKYDEMLVPCILIPSLCDSNHQQPQGVARRRRSVDEIFTMVYAGTCKPGDGFENLLSAVKKVVADGHLVRLHVVGTDGLSGLAASHRSTSEEDPLLRDCVRFLGRVSDEQYPIVLQDADCLVLPRPDNKIVRAAFPTRLPEFLSSGRPVLTTNVPDVPRYLIAGVHAEIVDGTDDSALAQGIVRLMGNPDRAEKIGLAGKQRCREVFDYRPYMAELAALIFPDRKFKIKSQTTI